MAAQDFEIEKPAILIKEPKAYQRIVVNTQSNMVAMTNSWKCCKCRHENYYDKWVCNDCRHERCKNCKDLLG